MDLTLVQTGPGDLISALKQMQAALPGSIADRANSPDLSDRDDFPRAVIALPEASEEDESLVEQVLARLGLPWLTLHRGALVVEIPADDTATVEPASDWELLVALRPDLAGPDHDTNDPTEDIWKAILERQPSGVAFPQESYDSDKAKAYAEVIKQFGGIVPHEDGGKNLSPSDIARLKRPRGPRIKKHAWEAVIEDLRDLLRFFEIARDWLDSGGTLRNNIRDQMFADMGFMVRLNTRYGLCDEKAPTALSMDIAMMIATRILGKAHPMVAFFFGLLWRVASEQRADKGIVKAKIKDMESALFDVFEQTIQSIEQALIALVADWGNLAAFVEQTRSGQIDWPDDAAPIRRAHAVGFHTACLMVLTKLKSDTETYESAAGRQTWGVVQYHQYCDNMKRHYEKDKGILRGQASDANCLNERWNDSWFFGSVHTPRPGPYGPYPPKVRLAPAALANKFFLPGTDADPGLGIADTFLDNPKVRAPWGLHSVRTKYAGRI